MKFNEQLNFVIQIINDVTNNTFVAALLAGALLAWLGLILYRRQKKIDIKFDDLRKLREHASLLFANIEIATKDYLAQLNIYDGKNPQIKLLSDALNDKFGNYFQNDTEKRLNASSTRIGSISDDLIARLKIYGQKYDSDIKIITDKIPMICVYLSGFMVIPRGNPDDVAVFRKGFTEAADEVRGSLQNLINTQS